SGDRGPGQLSVPVPAVSLRTLRMQRNIALALTPLLILLTVGLIAIVGAGVREGQLDPGKVADPTRLRRSRMVMAATTAVLAVVLWAANQWWNSEDGNYRLNVFKPLEVTASLESGDRLLLRLHDPGWRDRRVDDFVPDHDHLMHMYVIHLPEMERVWHLHPE